MTPREKHSTPSQSTTQSGEAPSIEETLTSYKFKKKAEGNGFVAYSRTNAEYEHPYIIHTLPEQSFKILEKQLQSKIYPLKEHFGFKAPEIGYFEIPVRRISPISRTFAPALPDRTSINKEQCPHTTEEAALHSIEATDARPVGKVGKIHATDPGGRGCIEVSWASPCGILWGIPNGRPYDLTSEYRTRFRSFLTLKIDLTEPGDSASFEDECMTLANSFMYEMNVRNGIPLEPIRFAEYARPAQRTRTPLQEEVRFPETKIKPEVAELFSFALGARDNPSLSFLAYYQIIEHFFPYAVRREAMRNIRKEMADPRFSRSDDSSILKVISAAEGTNNASESKQITTLISDSVRIEALTDFFSLSNWGQHFTSKGPISSVAPINLKDSAPLPTQVANRVYQIRNRIVHAKDDPKYADVRVILPKSKEAYALSPDIALLKLLAEEVVIDAQV
ncbi:hypothetical protein AB0F25_37275 [Streptomyces wedmorensis]|uniref:hypothetical protein n=1 Tax=Streptomyces wedmorensis TaxID=43759 RepID=UPI00343784A4